MLSDEEIKKALARGETVFMGGKKITRVEEIAKLSISQKPTCPQIFRRAKF